mgnify:CR=1 FL=1
MIFDSITQINIYDRDIIIDENGNILGASKATTENNGVLVLGEKNGGSVTSFSFGGISNICGGSISSFNNSSSIGGSQGTILNGPRSTPITINGVRTTYGQFIDLVQGVVTETISTPLPEYKLGKRCSIERIEVLGSGGLSSISPNWLSRMLTIGVRGSGTVQLPDVELTSINVNIAGSGDVQGFSTRAANLNVNIAGSGDVRGIHVLTCGSVSVAGSGDVDITAEHPNSVLRNVAGSGNINIAKKSIKKQKIDE